MKHSLSMAKTLLSSKKVTEEEEVNTAIKIVRSVQHMHNSMPTIVHQDLKPQNVLASHTVLYQLCEVFTCLCYSSYRSAKTFKVYASVTLAFQNSAGLLRQQAPVLGRGQEQCLIWLLKMFRDAPRGRAVDIYCLGVSSQSCSPDVEFGRG